MSEPRRVGLLDLLRTALGCQFVIPVYQRNYTWNADKEVKQFLSDLSHVLLGDYKNHFLGILIYLEKSIDFSTHELSIIDGQQRLTTTFLTIYAIKALLKEDGQEDMVKQLEGQFLTNPYHADKIKYKLKPLVADDDVYRCIVEDRFADIENTDSNVLKNYNYIRAYLDSLLAKGFSANQILMALDKLYVVCVPISEEDNAQKIFESINATGVKLTGADLIRNFLLMNLKSDLQDYYYANYWKKIEDKVSSDSKDLEMFFRMYLAVKTYILVPKNGVYRNFVDWINENEIKTVDLFKELLNYARYYYAITFADLSDLAKDIREPLADYRKVNSDIPLSLILELYHLFDKNIISAEELGKFIDAVNAFMLRRSLCDLDSQNISKLFPTTLKKVIETCSDNQADYLSTLNQEMVGNNAGTSGSYMPTDAQMYDLLINASVYKRPALKIVLDRLELHNNTAPVDLAKCSIEHLMPQTPTDEWLEYLGVDEETYMTNLHRLGNLTLASKPDNSIMSNRPWEYKASIIKGTGHLMLNKELENIKHWSLEHIEERTKELIGRICELYPYPNVKPIINPSNSYVNETEAKQRAVSTLFPDGDYIEVKKNALYCSRDHSIGYFIVSSKPYPEGENEKYWFGYREKYYEKLSDCMELRFVLVCRQNKALVIDLPKHYIDEMKVYFNNSVDDQGAVMHYHIVLHRYSSGKVTLQLSKPTLQRIDISNYIINEI